MKSSEVDPETGERHHLVQGITTAAATWLSAAVGIACGGGMYFTAGFSTALNLLLLRFGPRATASDDMCVASRLSGMDLAAYVKEEEDVEAGAAAGEKEKPSYGGMGEVQPLVPQSSHQSITSRRTVGSVRNRPSLM